MTIVEMKLCRGCNKEKPATTEFFHIDNRAPSGLNARCKDCAKEKYGKRKNGVPTEAELARERRALCQEGTKECVKCLVVKPATEEFFKRRSPSQINGKEVLRGVCIECQQRLTKQYYEDNKERILERSAKWHRDNYDRKIEVERARTIRVKYGITLDQYREMFESQSGLCAICSRPGVEKEGKRCRPPLAIDHCHISNKVRALLCYSCNSMIGMAHEDIGVLSAAIEYLKFHSNKLGESK